MKKIILASVILSLVLTATLASFAFALTTSVPPSPITTQTQLLTLIDSILNWVFTIFLIIAIILLILAGIQFITGGGDPEKISEARTKLIWSIAGIAVALIARGLPTLIQNLITP